LKVYTKWREMWVRVVDGADGKEIHACEGKTHHSGPKFIEDIVSKLENKIFQV
jgi:hypothetical protein